MYPYYFDCGLTSKPSIRLKSNKYMEMANVIPAARIVYVVRIYYY